MSKIRPKECQDVEFKRIWKDEYLKWICGFANAQGAVMYFGVDDDRDDQRGGHFVAVEADRVEYLRHVVGGHVSHDGGALDQVDDSFEVIFCCIGAFVPLESLEELRCLNVLEPVVALEHAFVRGGGVDLQEAVDLRAEHQREADHRHDDAADGDRAENDVIKNHQHITD